MRELRKKSGPFASDATLRAHLRARRSTRGRAPRRAVSVRASLKEEDELLGDLLANNAASFDGKLRTLVVGVSDFQGDEMLNHRNSTTSTLFKHRRWLDGIRVIGVRGRGFIAAVEVEECDWVFIGVGRDVGPLHDRAERAHAPGAARERDDGVASLDGG